MFVGLIGRFGAGVVICCGGLSGLCDVVVVLCVCVCYELVASLGKGHLVMCCVYVDLFVAVVMQGICCVCECSILGGLNPD